MINENMYQLGSAPNAIRALFAYGLERKAIIGNDKVFDFSIGNPSIPAPYQVEEAIVNLVSGDPQSIHGYTPAAGAADVRQAIADSINRRFGMKATPDTIYLSAGAAASLSISIQALSEGEEEFIVITPYFPEYRVWIEHAGCTCIEVPANQQSFQLDVAALENAITPKTKGIIINSPNNPVGTVYSRASLEALAKLLTNKEQEFQSEIFLICDEPYREIVYDNVEVPYVPAIYDRTIVCYSYSKSLSLPGERIGYLYVSERMPHAHRVYLAVCGAGRALGFVCAPSLFQQVIKHCVDTPSDVAAYDENRHLLTEELTALGYECIEPQGAFYLWVKALEPNAEAFAEKAKAYELLLVPSTSFGCQGWVRVSYCVAKQTIQASIPAFKALMEDYKTSRNT